MAVSELSLYVHLPICPSRCDYCDFYSEAIGPGERETTGALLVGRILADTEAWLESPFLEHLGEIGITTVYLGGGSPTYLGPDTLGRLLDGLARRLPTAPGAEWSVESHPIDLSREIVAVLEGSPVTRLSLGVQSFDTQTLLLIGRRDPEASDPESLARVLTGWSGTLSVDLIGERPGQSAPGLRRDLETALGLGARHLSVYPLSWPGRGIGGRPDPRDRLGYPDFDAWEIAEDTLGAAGFQRYEVSNFAEPGFECRHSVAYWRMAPYLGVGPGAVGTIPYPPGTRREERWTLRSTGIQPIAAFLNSAETPGIRIETQNKRESLFERFMMGLRLTEGVSLGALGREFGASALEGVKRALGPFLDMGLLEELEVTGEGDRRLRCVPEGRLRLDEILRELTNIIE